MAGIMLFLSAALFVVANAKLHCKLPPVDIPKDWITLTDPCVKAMSDQVQEELTASMTYLAMAAHFSQDTINRPGFAEMFYKSANEEREHAIKILEYLLMRGGLTSDISKLIRNPTPIKTSWDAELGGSQALKDALLLEARVTRKIRDIITVCESPTGVSPTFNDYHLVDYLTGDFLTEQYEGQRHLAGLASTLGKMMDSHGPIGEFLFDKQLLEKN